MDLYCPLVFFQHGSLATMGIHLSESFSWWGLQFRIINRTVLLIVCCVSKLCRELKILNLGHIIYWLNLNFWVKELEIWLFNLCSWGPWMCNFVFLYIYIFFLNTLFAYLEQTMSFAIYVHLWNHHYNQDNEYNPMFLHAPV